MPHILHVVGARPNFMKMAPVHRALAAIPNVQSRILHTGQHYDRLMSDVFFEDLQLPLPDVSLGVGCGSHAEQTEEINRTVTDRLANLLLITEPSGRRNLEREGVAAGAIRRDRECHD